jgi:hypothetical protein
MCWFPQASGPARTISRRRLLQGFAIGGLSELPRAEFNNARLSMMLAEEFGAFGFKPHVLADLLAGKRVAVRPAEDTYWRTLSGAQRAGNLETAMQLIYKLFTHEVRAHSSTGVYRCLRTTCSRMSCPSVRLPASTGARQQAVYGLGTRQPERASMLGCTQPWRWLTCKQSWLWSW